MSTKKELYAMVEDYNKSHGLGTGKKPAKLAVFDSYGGSQVVVIGRYTTKIYDEVTNGFLSPTKAMEAFRHEQDRYPGDIIHATKRVAKDEREFSAQALKATGKRPKPTYRWKDSGGK